MFKLSEIIAKLCRKKQERVTRISIPYASLLTEADLNKLKEEVRRTFSEAQVPPPPGQTKED